MRGRTYQQPPPAAALMRELLREEDARLRERPRHKALQASRDGLQGGAILLAMGVGLSIFLYAVAQDKGVWTLGIMVVLVGLVVSTCADFRQNR